MCRFLVSSLLLLLSLAPSLYLLPLSTLGYFFSPSVFALCFFVSWLTNCYLLWLFIFACKTQCISLVRSHHHLHYIDFLDSRGTGKDKGIIQFGRPQHPESTKRQHEEERAYSNPPARCSCVMKGKLRQGCARSGSSRRPAGTTATRGLGTP